MSAGDEGGKGKSPNAGYTSAIRRRKTAVALAAVERASVLGDDTFTNISHLTLSCNEASRAAPP